LDQPTGPKTEAFLLDGKDPFLLSLSRKKKLFVHYDESGWPIEKRVGQHCSIVLEIFQQYGKRNPERAIVVHGIPRYAEVVKKGVGSFFHDPSTAEKDKIYMN
ncbi:MAG: succinylglutamate desuccinylase, partial [Candidatus Aminicenantales bacterium]